MGNYGIVLILFLVLGIISMTCCSILVCDTFQLNSICTEKRKNNVQLIDTSPNSEYLDELFKSEDYYDILNRPTNTRRKRGTFGLLATSMGTVTNLLSIKKSMDGQEKTNQDNPVLIETNAKLYNIQRTIHNNLADIKDMSAQLGRNQKNLGSYVTSMNTKLNSIQNSLGNMKLVNGRLDNVANSQESNMKVMTLQLQNVQKNLGSIQEMNKKLNSNQKSLDDYVRRIMNSKIDNIQKSLGDYMKGVNIKLSIIQKVQEENRKAIDGQLERIQNGVQDLKERIQVHFKDLDDNMNGNLESVKHDLQEAFEVQKKQLAINQLKTEFSKYERIIEDSLRYSILYRKTNSTTSRTAFLKSGSQLESAVDAILDGLRGGGIFGSDILAAIRIGKQNYGTKFIRAYEDIQDLLGIAVDVLDIYYRTSNADQIHINEWIDGMVEKETLVIKRVRNIEIDCRNESKNVFQDIAKIVRLYSNETAKEVNQRLYDHLSTKYDTSLWYVITSTLWKENLKKSFFSSTSSNIRRFEVFDTEVETNVVAYSFDRNDMVASGDGHLQLSHLYSQMNIRDPILWNKTLGNGCSDIANAFNKDKISGFILNAIPNKLCSHLGSSNIAEFVHHVYCKPSSLEYSLFILPGGKSNSGKYFKIMSQLSGQLIVDASTLASKLPGGHVHLKPDTGSDGSHQFWYLDGPSQTIRAMQTDLCLTFNGLNQVYLNWCDTSPSDQQLWRLKKDETIVSWANPMQCLQVQEYSNADTPRLTQRNCTGALNQKFTIKY